MRSPFLWLTLSGCLLLLAGLWGGGRSSDRRAPPEGQGRALARISPVSGSAELRRGHRTTVITRAIAGHRMDTVSTSDDGEALIAFENGEEIRLLASSRLTIDKEAGRPLIILKAGDFLPEKILESDATARVLRDGVRRRLAEDQTVRRPVAAAPESPPTTTPRKATRPAPQAATKVERLTAEYIQDVLKSNRGLFFKCYTQLLQRQPGTHGDATLTLSIDATGRIRTADVASTQIPDPEFRGCLTTAAKRVEFKAFAGEPVQAMFPLRFE